MTSITMVYTRGGDRLGSGASEWSSEDTTPAETDASTDRENLRYDPGTGPDHDNRTCWVHPHDIPVVYAELRANNHPVTVQSGAVLGVIADTYTTVTGDVDAIKQHGV